MKAIIAKIDEGIRQITPEARFDLNIHAKDFAAAIAIMHAFGVDMPSFAHNGKTYWLEASELNLTVFFEVDLPEIVRESVATK